MSQHAVSEQRAAETRPTSRPRRPGRPHSTTRRQLELVALGLFAEDGFDATTVDRVAAAAGVSRRTFFRYFDSKAAVLWNTFDQDVSKIRRSLNQTSDDLTMMDAIRSAVVATNHYGADDVPELRTRLNLIGSVPHLQASATLHYEAWERAISEFVAIRVGQPAESLYPLAVGRAVLAVCRSAYDRWLARADTDLQVYLDAAMRALGQGFDPATMPTEPGPRARKGRINLG